MHCDILIVGGGVSGLIAAKIASDDNKKVLLLEDKELLGGSLIYDDSDISKIDNQKSSEWLKKLIDDIKKKLPKVSLQVGGGFRNKETIERALNSGIDQIILGSLAVKDPILFHDIASSYPDKIIFGLDTKNDYVKSEAWTEDSEVYWIDLVKKFNDLPLNSIIFTDIDRDGMLNGPNLEKITELTSNTSLPVIASGGVSSLEDLIQLKQIKGVSGVISGKALYENTFSLDEALNLIS